MENALPPEGDAVVEQHPLRILVAEDELVNQKIVLHILQHLGYQADAVMDGLQVLAAMQRERYDLILMDLHMPEMDGFKAAQFVRQCWPRHEQPWIVALTAGLLAGDARYRYQPVIDDYLLKPISIQTMADLLHRCDHQRYPGTTSAATTGAVLDGETEATLDQTMFQRLQDIGEDQDVDLVREVIELFFTEAVRLLGEAQQSHAATDRLGVFRAAHTLKSSSGSIGAARLAKLSADLEWAAHNDPAAPLGELIARCNSEYARVAEVLATEKRRLDAAADT